MSGQVPEQVLPRYDGGCIADIVGALLDPFDPRREATGLMPAEVLEARAHVLVLLDGLGAEQLARYSHLAPTLTEMHTATITTVAPTTTVTALVSLATGLTPGRHGLVSYRIPTATGNLNMLSWKTPGKGKKAIEITPPESVQVAASFGGQRPPVVQKDKHANSGFSRAYLRDARHVGYKSLESVPATVHELLRRGESFVYVYYEGVDVAAHENAFTKRYRDEIRACEALIADLLVGLPRDTAVVITADHGLVDCSKGRINLDAWVKQHAAHESGEARFRWLHARPGHQRQLLEAASATYSDKAWVHTRDEIIEAGWFGPVVTDVARSRLGDVALVAHGDWAFEWPGHHVSKKLLGRHGSLTPAEMLVPLLTYVN